CDLTCLNCTHCSSVLVPPNIYQQPQDRLIAESGAATLTCTASGSPPIKYQWKKGSSYVSQPSPVSYHPLNNVDTFDSGEYYCVVSNPVGSVISSAAVVQVAYIREYQGGPTTFSVNAGYSIELECPQLDTLPDSSPDFHLTWKKDNFPINGGNVVISLDHKLVILSASESNEGQYHCSALNTVVGNGMRESPTINLYVNGNRPSSVGPRIIVPPKDTVFTQGDPTVQLECIASATPLDLKITLWKRNGMTISQSANKLILFNPSSIDEGVYECEVSLQYHSYSSVRATATISMRTEPVWMLSPVAVTTGDVNEPIEIPCKASGVPEPMYKWYQNGIDVSTLGNNRFIVLSTGSLQITSLHAEDQAMFQCFASNVVADISVSTWLQVERLAPNITNPPNDTSVLAGSTARLHCGYSGSPAPDVIWKKDDTVVVSSTINVMSNGDLIISTAKVADSGLYTCTVVNNVASVTASATLTVQVKTRISDPPKDMEVIKGSTGIFQCGVLHDSNVAVRILWLMNNVEIDLSSSNRISVLYDGSLKIAGARSDDIGNYTCTVTSPGGNDARTASLVVIELPFAPQFLHAVLSIDQRRSIDLQWLESFDGNKAILRYKVFRKENAEIVWTLIMSNVAPGVENIVTIPDLTPSYQYAFAVSAVNELGEGPLSDPSNNVTLPVEPPDAAPQGVVASPRSSSSIRIQWQAPPQDKWNGPLTGYRIRYRLKGYSSSPYSYQDIYNPQQQSYELTDLITWDTYEIQIAANNSMGPGVYSLVIIVRTLEGVPTEAPQVVVTHANSSTSIFFQWMSPSPQKIFGVNQGYKLKAWEPSNPDYKVVKVVPPNPQYSLQENYITGLKKFTVYLTSVLCYTRAGDGPESDELQVETFQDVPGPVGDLRFFDIYDDSLKVDWTEPEEINGILIGYTVGWQEYNISSTYQSEEISSDTVVYTVTGLTQLTTYEIMVSASTQMGAGPTVVSTISSGVPPELPTNPVNVVISNVQARSVNIQFTPGYNGKTSINTWKVEAQINGAEQWVTHYEHHDPDALGFVVPDLLPYTKYILRVTAINVVGASHPSDPTSEFETLQDYPSTAPASVTVRANSETSLTISWIPLTREQWNGVPLGYRVSWRSKPTVVKRSLSNGYFQSVNIDDYIGRTYVIEDLEEWMWYEVKVLAYNAKGNGPYSDIIEERTGDSVPSAGPQNVVAVSTGSTTIDIAWVDIPQSDQNGEILGYKVLYCESFADVDSCEYYDITDNSSRSTRLSNLKKYVTYDIQVLGYTRIGNGVLSEPAARIRTDEDVPGPVTGILFPNVSNSYAKVQWEDPPERNGILTKFKISYKLMSDDAQIIDGTELDINTHSYEASNLNAQEYYEFTISAATRLGWGEPAVALVLTVNNRDPPQSPFGLIVDRQLVFSRSIALLWSRGSDGNSPIRYFTIQYRKKLSPYSTYQFRVQAHNDVGASYYSIPSEPITTLQDFPEDSPTITDVIPYTATSLRVIWRPPASEDINGILNGFKIQYKILRQISYMEHVISDTRLRQFDLTDLSIYENYEIVMRVFNIIGEGPPSAPYTIYVGEAIPTAAPDDVSAVPIGPTQIRVTWKEPPENTQNGGLQGYKIFYWKVSDEGDNIDNEHQMMRPVGVELTEVLLDQLVSYTNYKIQVLGFNAAGDGPKSAVIRVRTDQTLPGTPGPLIFTKITMNAVNVTWASPIKPNGIIIGYQVIYKPLELVEGISKIITVDITGEEKTYLYAAELAEIKMYEFSVKAKTEKGYGEPRIGNVTTGPQPGAPSAPRNVKMERLSSSVFLSWLPPNNTGASPIKNYAIEGYPMQVEGTDSDSHWEELISNISPQATSYSIDFKDLRSNHEYIFRVSAINNHSYSLPSKQSPVLGAVVLFSPIYEQYWFLILIAAVGVLLILMLVILLCVLGRNKRYRTKRKLHGVDNTTVEVDDGGFATFELHPRRNTKENRKNSNYGRQPPRPSPGSVLYSDENPSKFGDGDSSSLTEKPSSLGDSTDSEASDSEVDSDVKDPHSFMNHYVNDPMRQSWKRQRPSKAYSYTDSEPDTVYSNGVVITNGMLNLQPGSRAPLAGFSSFV
ncbi:protein sidekick-2-like, partial [Saccoglossus kowalevskii]